MTHVEDVRAAVEEWLTQLDEQGYAYTTIRAGQQVPVEQYEPDGAP